MIFHENCLPADDSHEISCIICYFWKAGKFRKCCLLQIIGGALWVKRLPVKISIQWCVPVLKNVFVSANTVRHWKENLPSQKYAFLEGIVFQLNNFTMDGFSFQFFHWKLEGLTIHLNDKFWMENPSKTSFSLQIWHPIGCPITGLMM